MIKIFIGIIAGFIIGVIITGNYYGNKYTKLRAEIIMSTGVDISYPYEDQNKLNKSWF